MRNNTFVVGVKVMTLLLPIFAFFLPLSLERIKQTEGLIMASACAMLIVLFAIEYIRQVEDIIGPRFYTAFLHAVISIFVVSVAMDQHSWLATFVFFGHQLFFYFYHAGLAPKRERLRFYLEFALCWGSLAILFVCSLLYILISRS